MSNGTLEDSPTQCWVICAISNVTFENLHFPMVGRTKVYQIGNWSAYREPNQNLILFGKGRLSWGTIKMGIGDAHALLLVSNEQSCNVGS